MSIRIKNALAKLEVKRRAYVTRHEEKVIKLKEKCKHDYHYYEHHYNNYDLDISTGYKCRYCESKLSVVEYNELKRKIK